MGPPQSKLGAGLSEITNQFLEPGVTRIECTGRVKLCQGASRQLFPIGIERLIGGVGEESPDRVTRVRGGWLINGKHALSNFVPCQIVPSPSYHKRRIRVQVRDHLLEGRANMLF